MFQLSPLSDGTYQIKLRKDGRYVTGKTDRYAYGICSFKYMDDEIRDSITTGKRPISYRIKLRDKKVYLQATNIHLHIKHLLYIQLANNLNRQKNMYLYIKYHHNP